MDIILDFNCIWPHTNTEKYKELVLLGIIKSTIIAVSKKKFISEKRKQWVCLYCIIYFKPN
jgi:hypothetical protein